MVGEGIWISFASMFRENASPLKHKGLNMDEQVRIKKELLSSLVKQFCEHHLNEEYSRLCERVILKLSRKRQVPFMSGKIKVWAAGIVWCIARTNFLFDKQNPKFLTGETITNHFTVSKSVMGQKATFIDRTLKIGLFDDEYCTEELAARNPLRGLVMVNGFIVPKDMLQ